MALPVTIGTVITGSLIKDTGSYWWGQWQQPCNPNQEAVTWKISVIVATAGVMSLVYSTTQSAAGIVATGALKSEGLPIGTVNANVLQTYTVPMRRGVYMNAIFVATTTVKQFWVTQSDRDVSIG